MGNDIKAVTMHLFILEKTRFGYKTTLVADIVDFSTPIFYITLTFSNSSNSLSAVINIAFCDFDNA